MFLHASVTLQTSRCEILKKNVAILEFALVSAIITDDHKNNCSNLKNSSITADTERANFDTL